MADQDVYIPSGNLGDTSGAVDSVNGQSGTVVLDQDDVGDGATHKQYSSTEKTKLAGIETAADVTDAGNVGSSIHGTSGKTTPVDADELGLLDSAASFALKVLTWANLKATLKTYFDSLTTTLTNKTMSGSSNTFSNIGNSSLTNSSLTVGSTSIALGATATTLAGVTLTTPTIASFTNANHNHSNSAGGGALASSAVDSAGATMNSDTSLAGNGYFLDEDDMASDSATKVASQQSIKAFVIASIAASGGGDVSSNTATSVDSEIALFSSTSGKLIKRATGSGIAKLASGVLSVVTAPSGALVGDTDSQTLTNKTLTTPTIASFTNATHDHSNAAGGGNIPFASVTNNFWQELGRTTLGVAGDTVSVTGLTAKKYLRVLFSGTGTGTITQIVRFNNDSGNNYAHNLAVNGGASSGTTSAAQITLTVGDSNNNYQSALDIVNITAIEKSVIGSAALSGTGAGTGVNMVQVMAKWVNTSAQITRIDFINTNTGDFAIGTEVVVLGHD